MNLVETLDLDRVYFMKVSLFFEHHHMVLCRRQAAVRATRKQLELMV
jgi:hypothetical protein